VARIGLVEPTGGVEGPGDELSSRELPLQFKDVGTLPIVEGAPLVTLSLIRPFRNNLHLKCRQLVNYHPNIFLHGIILIVLNTRYRKKNLIFSLYVRTPCTVQLNFLLCIHMHSFHTIKVRIFMQQYFFNYFISY